MSDIKDEDIGVYCSINYNGEIPLLKLKGPLRNIMLSKQKIVELIRAGYDVSVAYYPNPGMIKFRKQVEDYKAACRKKDYDKMRLASAVIFGANTNTESISIASSVNEAAAAATQMYSQPQPQVNMPFNMAFEPVPNQVPEPEPVNEYSESLNALEQGNDSGDTIAPDDQAGLYSDPTTYSTPKNTGKGKGKRGKGKNTKSTK